MNGHTPGGSRTEPEKRASQAADEGSATGQAAARYLAYLRVFRPLDSPDRSRLNAKVRRWIEALVHSRLETTLGRRRAVGGETEMGHCLASGFECYARTTIAFVRLAMIRIMLSQRAASPSS